MKNILYIDLDGTIANLGKAINKLRPDLDPKVFHTDVGDLFKANPMMFHSLEPMEGAVDSIIDLSNDFDIYFLSTPVWEVPESYSGKRIWLANYFGKYAERKLILTHRKDLAIGHFLVDDNLNHGVSEFKGEHIHFGTEKFPNWEETHKYLKHKAKWLKS